MEQYELKKLDLDALHLVYRDHLTPDFPPAERKPMAAMEKLLDAGRYEPWGLYRGEELMAYAMMWKDPEGSFELLDYLGVCQGKPRGQGIGTVMVAYLMDHYSHVEGILVEAEAEDESVSEEENALRRRRLCGRDLRRALRHVPLWRQERGGGHGGPPAPLPLRAHPLALRQVHPHP